MTRPSDLSSCLGCIAWVSGLVILAGVGSAVAHAGRMCGAWEPNDTTVERDCGSDGHYRCPQCQRFDAASFERRCVPEVRTP